MVWKKRVNVPLNKSLHAFLKTSVYTDPVVFWRRSDCKDSRELLCVINNVVSRQDSSVLSHRQQMQHLMPTTETGGKRTQTGGCFLA